MLNNNWNETWGKAAEHLSSGLLVFFPTDTIYGIAATVDSCGAQALTNIKKRSKEKRFVILCGNYKQLLIVLDKHKISIGQLTKKIILELSPGKITYIFNRSDEYSVAIRIPKLPPLQHLLFETGPLLVTSANISGKMPMQYNEIMKKWGNKFLIIPPDEIYHKSELPSAIIKIDEKEKNIFIYRSSDDDALLQVTNVAEKYSFVIK